MMNPRPISNRKKVQFLVALTFLAWATQTLLHQWARGEDAPEAVTDAQAPERFIDGAARVGAGAALEIKAEATVQGDDVKLRRICRWADSDGHFFAPLADLTIVHFQGPAPYESVSLDEIRQTLHDAGANLAVIRFAGATACTVARSDVKFDEGTALQRWVDARQGKVPAAAAGEAPATAGPAALPLAPLPAAPIPAVRALRDLIIADAAIRLAIPADMLQVNFNPADDKVLNLAEPQFKFNLQARRVFGLGDVLWDVLIVTDSGNKKVSIEATARAWQNQVVLVRPVAARQIIQDQDMVQKRVLTDRLPDEPLLTVTQCVGQECSRDLKPGTLLTARMVNPVDLAKPGQFITVTLASGNIRVKTVARALEAGSYGQSVKVKNEATHEIYEVILTGAQEGTISPMAIETKPGE